jgi:hypothetical protein
MALLVGYALGAPTARAQQGREGEGPGKDAARGQGSSEEVDPFEWVVLPLGGYDSDRGGGGALLAMLFWNEPGVEPYRDRVFAIVSLTHKLVQTHSLSWERVGLFEMPLRLRLKAAFDANPIDNFCGLGNRADCARHAAAQAARDYGLDPSSDSGDEFADQYYKVRYMRVRGSARVLYEGLGIEGLQLKGAWRVTWNSSGFYAEQGPYPGSLYGQMYPDGEEGLQSELELGAVLDRRDHERRPTQGYVLSASLRGAHRFWGSDWNYVGGTAAATGYVPLDPGHRLVFAGRALADLIGGEPPSYVLGSVGGFWSAPAFGGSQIGRGLRRRRFIGRIKLVTQGELRWAVFGDPDTFRLTAQTFVDLGWVAVDWDHVGGNPRKVLAGFGGGLGGSWGENFVLRLDVAFSPHEDYEPYVYLLLSHPY